MAAQATKTIISADSHMLEPPNLWVERLDSKFRDQAPKVYWDEKKESWYFGSDSVAPRQASGLFAAGKTAEELVEFQKAGFDDARAGGWDPGERLKDMQIDGVSAEVLYTSLGFNLFWIEDGPFQEDCFRVYNDWLAEFVNHDPKHFAGLGLISMWNVENGVKELERCRKMGLKGGMIWASPPDEKSFASDYQDTFWAAAQDLEMPISLHILTGSKESRTLTNTSVQAYQRRMSLPAEIQRSLSDIIFSGVLERFPKLQIVSAENDIGWIAYFLQRADKSYHRLRYLNPTGLTMAPSDYFRRQIFATFMDDTAGAKSVPQVGADNFMWSSDYPHQASTWPHSMDIIARDFKDMPEEDKQKIVHDNCAALYDLNEV